MSKQTQGLYEFGPFRLDAGERQLLRDGQPQPLPPKAFATLLALVERSGRLVEKEELVQTLWPDTVVEDANLNHHIWVLRKALGEGQQYIETVPKHGFRFTAAVRRLPDASADVVLEKHTLTRIVAEVETSHETESVPLSPTPVSLVAQKEKPKRMGRSYALAVGLVCLLVTGTSVLLYRPWAARRMETRAAEATSRQLPRSIAVLPFKSIGVADENEYLGLGMSDALITRLGNSRQLVVRPTSAVRQYTDPNQDSAAIGRQQGVEAVLDGSIQRDGDRLRVTVQLINVADGATLWTAQFDEHFTDIFTVQDSISERVACDLITRICGKGDAQFARQQKINIEAYQAYLKGRYFWNKRAAEGYQKAVEYFSQAIEKDPAYARAYAGLGDAILFRGGNSLKERDEALAKGRAALRKAIEIDETLAEPHATLGLLAMNIEHDWAEAEKEYRRAIELNPNYATAHHWYGEFLAYLGRFDEGLLEVKRAQELDPLSLIISTDLGSVYYQARQYDRAVEQLRRTLEMDPSFIIAHQWLGLAYSAQGLHEEAIKEFQQIKEIANDQMQLSMLAYVHGMAGHRDEAQKALKRMALLSKQTYVFPSSFLRAYIGLGDKEAAFKWMEQTFAERDVGVLALKVSPMLDSLRSDPRYASFLRRAGFAS
jgi:TolB-like protein/DNA-binding winged helix-turn-helix (wHTH) protein/Tfp pilus assembly protein PilF